MGVLVITFPYNLRQFFSFFNLTLFVDLVYNIFFLYC